MKATLNGTHSPHDTAPALEPKTEVSAGINPVAPFLPDSQVDHADNADMDDLFGDDAGDAPTLDAPISEQSASESTQKVPETQFPESKPETADPMDISPGAQDVPVKSEEPSSQTVDNAPTKPMHELSIQTQQSSPSHLPAHSTAPIDHEMQDTPSSGKVRAREDDDEEEARYAKRTKTEETDSEGAKPRAPEQPVVSAQTSVNGVAQPEQSSMASQASQPSQTPAGDIGVQAAVDFEPWPTSPMTQAQHKFLLERIRNTKKIKSSSAFREPVNPEALGIPAYRTIVTNPMDLSTMESKLKEGRYPRVRDFMEDLDLIINNSVLFNSTTHPVTLAGFDMRQYFLRGMYKMPRGAEEPAKPKAKKPGVAQKVSRPKPAPPARSSVPPPTAASPQDPWPLTQDGLPVIRRDSSSINDRPKREIHRPPPKDLPYNNAKPKKKKYQQELRFCESVLAEIMKPKYHKIAYPFKVPVDPVALNIPSYLKIIKKPMDFGTIEKNLKAGQYQKASDFYNDAQLVFKNCFTFNPEGDEVNRMGKDLQRVFDDLWAEKADWLAVHAPASDNQSPGSDYSEDEAEEAEDEPVDPKIAEIQRQIQELNETAQALLASKRSSPAHTAPKKKSSKPAAPKKKTSLAVPPPPKPLKSKPKKALAPLSFREKQEISEGIQTLGEEEMRRAVQIIKNGCPHLRDVNDDEMEIDMDDISDDTLRELYKFIKSTRAPVSKSSIPDDDFEPPRPSHKAQPGKPKKNKPMGKKEQEESIRRIEEQLGNFTKAGGAGAGAGGGYSASPPGKTFDGRSVHAFTDDAAANDDESSDDESSGSESEEE
jgi:bromodomain-containing factor 1